MNDNHSTDDSELQPLINESMGRIRPRPWWYSNYRILVSPHSLRYLICSCFTAFSCFSIVLYLNFSLIRLVFNPQAAQYNFQRNNQQSHTTAVLKQARKLSEFDQKISYNDFNYLDTKSLTYEKLNYGNQNQILYRFPKQRDISGLLLIFHGCSRSAHDWFHTIERQRIVGSAIDLGFACLAFQATDRMRRCWTSETDVFQNEDVQMVNQGLKQFYDEYPKLKSLPRYTFGASSGGIFSSIYATNSKYAIQGQIIFISIVHPDILDINIRHGKYPPTAWIYMVRDVEFASENRINASMKVFANEQIPHIAFKIEPISLTPSTFRERIPTITDDASHYLYYRLQQNKWLDQQNYLVFNPRRVNKWETFLLDATNQTKDIETQLKNIHEHKDILPDFLNTIYGEHEISFERSFEALTWLQKMPISSR